MRAQARVPGTCGELVQGTTGDCNFLISFPIDRYSSVAVRLTKEHQEILVFPSWCTKVQQAVAATLDFLQIQGFGAVVQVETQLPVGKGWASSSADIIAAISSTAACFNKRLSYREIANLALAIEPTDSIFLPGLAIFDHLQGTIMESIGPAVPLEVLAIEFNNTIDTLDFNSQADLTKKNREKEQQVYHAMQLVRQGIREGCPQKVAEGATISALAHQNILFKPFLEEIYSLSLSYNALGICIAHSGTTIGILYDKRKGCDKRLSSQLINRFPGIQHIHFLNTTCGGISTGESFEELTGVEAY